MLQPQIFESLQQKIDEDTAVRDVRNKLQFRPLGGRLLVLTDMFCARPKKTVTTRDCSNAREARSVKSGKLVLPRVG